MYIPHLLLCILHLNLIMYLQYSLNINVHALSILVHSQLPYIIIPDHTYSKPDTDGPSIPDHANTSEILSEELVPTFIPQSNHHLFR